MTEAPVTRKNPGGRPTKFTPEIALAICDRLKLGESLVAICESDEMPDRITAIRWMEKDNAFATMVESARKEQADFMDDEIIRVMRKVEVGKLRPEVGRVVLGALQWRAARLNGRKYGDKQNVEHSGSISLEALVTQSLTDDAKGK